VLAQPLEPVLLVARDELRVFPAAFRDIEHDILRVEGIDDGRRKPQEHRDCQKRRARRARGATPLAHGEKNATPMNGVSAMNVRCPTRQPT